MKTRLFYCFCPRGIMTFLMVSLTVCWMTGCGFFSPNPHKADKALIDDFQKNKADMNRLVQLLKENSNLKDSKVSDQELKENKVTDEKVKEYELLWRKLFPFRPSVNSKIENSLCFTASQDTQKKNTGEGDDIFYSSKGYCWLDNPSQARVVDNLDNFDEKTRQDLKTGEKTKAFRNIEGNWYLNYSADHYYVIDGE